jgi:transposase
MGPRSSCPPYRTASQPTGVRSFEEFISDYAIGHHGWMKRPTGPARGAGGGRPPRFDRVRHRQRNQVERRMNRRKQFRAVATRYDKLACRYQATVCVADIWLRARPDQPRA